MPRQSPCSRSSIRRLVLGGLFAIAGLAQAQQAVPEGASSSDDAMLLACQKSVPCRTHLDKATQLYKQERYAAALDEYQAAYVLQPYPLILYNMARIYHKQGLLADAMAYYQRYLDTRHAERAERARMLLAEAQAEREKKESPRALPAGRAQTPAPAPSVQAPLSAVAAAPVAPVRSSPPLYKKWWLWTVVGVAVLGAATGLGMGLYARGPDVAGLPAKSFSFGN